MLHWMPNTIAGAVTACHCYFFFFFNDTATTEIYTLSLHDALPISLADDRGGHLPLRADGQEALDVGGDRESTRLNSRHPVISYAVFCLKKKKTTKNRRTFRLWTITIKIDRTSTTDSAVYTGIKCRQ